MKVRLITRAMGLLLLILIASMDLMSCSPGSGFGSSGATNSTTTSGATTISFWIRNSDQNFVTPLVKAYNASHKNQVKLTTIPDSNFVTKFGTALASNTAPDVIAIDLIYLPAFDAANQMTDITNFAHKLPYFDKLSPSHIRLATYNDKVYGLPFSAEGSVMIYNKDLFRKAGLDPNKPPTTWQEIEDYSKKITALGNDIKGFYFPGRCAGCNAFTLLPLIWASGGDVLNSDGTQATMTSPAVKDALTFYHRLWSENQIAPGARVDDGTNFLNAFTTGKIGMTGTGAFSIATIKNQYPNIDFGITPLPGEKGGTASFAGGDTIGVPRGSKHATEAYDFISWCLSDDVQLNQYAKNNQIPVRTDLSSNPYSQKDPRYQTVANAMAKGRTPYSVHYNQLFNDANGPWIAAIQKAVFDGQVDQALNTAQQQFTQILNSSS
ncbi:ABC transporter substrate-binding protein [Ktedonosporobacter rubrisoli]|uniref:ABC transporter substrate-binding protein n=1 Tax=Ktedonosporobacter rubrisoli TaxID=2509675 RepID=A0A4P6K4Q6_KTERU|nr:ABC transporter substrate-binding protein [Ktedonosporobacter rubrisoli]QBD82942.1 ABC transporter substrate-binding protein [Ktedonosporobacter rubrisoli]